MNNQNNQVNIPSEYKPISMWGYFGYQILFAIPIIGFILLLVFALGGTKNINLKNFARSYFCLFIIVIVILILLTIFGAASYFTIS
ncbi:MAG: ABC transporter permease [Bacilli bacterium]|nr:ABC transporter permease [Bacilli bacterium]